MDITSSQVDAIQHGEVVEITFDEMPCVVVRKDLFERMRSRANEDVDVRAMEPLLAELAPEDWEDLSNYETNSDETKR